MRSLLLTSFVLVSLLTVALRLLNLKHLHQNARQVPPELAGTVSAETLGKINAYTEHRIRAGLVHYLAAQVALGVVLFGGLLSAFDLWSGGITEKFVGRGVLFFLGASWAAQLFDLPFGLYNSFVLEARHGFNRTTAGLWWSDWFKGLLLSSVLGAAFTAGALALVQLSPQLWWLWAWLFVLGFGVFMMLISPYVIEPLFFKITPLTVPELEQEVKDLAAKAGVRVSRVLTMDASRRSSHSNAYFTGLGPTKRVVLFDTLLKQMNFPEVTAVLAHELGHWKKRHVLIRLLVSQVLALGLFVLAHQLLRAGVVPHWLGLEQASFPAQVVILLFAGSLLSFPLTPLGSAWSRRHEWEADRYAIEITRRPQDLASALAKLARDNLSNLNPHPLFAAFYASHPPMPIRIRKLLENPQTAA